jgi:hypothetical protein
MLATLQLEIDVDDQKEGKSIQKQYNNTEKVHQQEITMLHEQKSKEPLYSGEPTVSVWESSSDEEDLVMERKRAKGKQSTPRMSNLWPCQKDLRADLDFSFLPSGVNNKIIERDPLKDKLRRMFKHKPSKSPPMLDANQPILTPRLGSASDDDERPTGARVGLIPSIPPMNDSPRRKFLDDFCNPISGNLGVLTETMEEEVDRRNAVQNEADLCAASDRRLNLSGRQHVADPKIGRAPPLTRRALTAPRLRRSREPLNSETFTQPIAPTIIEADAPQNLPIRDDPAHVLGPAFMPYKNTNRPREGSIQAGEECSSTSSGSPTESLPGVNIGLSSGFPYALAKVDSGYHSVITQCSINSLKQASLVSSTGGSKLHSRIKRTETHPDYTIQPIHPEQDVAPNERKTRPIPEEEKEEAIDSTTKGHFVEDHVREHPLTPPETPTSLLSFPENQPQRTAAAEKPEASQTGATDIIVDPISKEFNLPKDVAPEKRQISLPLPTKLPPRTKPALEIDTSVSVPVTSGALICHGNVVVEKYGCLNVSTLTYGDFSDVVKDE